MQRINIHHDFAIPVEKLFAHLSEHENLETIFHPTKVRRLSDGQGTRNGVGSAREMRALGGPAFVETVTAYRENELIEYRITKGSPLKNHLGVMRFSSTPTGSHLHYTIEFEGRLPLIGAIIRAVLDRGIRKGLNKITR
jgi:uncharacterized protein YndB with AHSA1/START domain